MAALILLSVALTLVVFVASAAHVLEFPGKLRLDEESYRRVQTIYYPGFTIAGFAEPLGIFSCLITTMILSAGTSRTLIAVTGCCLLVVHLAYWTLTHPVNAYWLNEEKLGSPAKAFFGTPRGTAPSWIALRNRWEISHAVRTLFAGAALIAAGSSLLNFAR